MQKAWWEELQSEFYSLGAENFLGERIPKKFLIKHGTECSCLVVNFLF